MASQPLFVSFAFFRKRHLLLVRIAVCAFLQVLAICPAGTVADDNWQFPAGSGIIDVTQAPYSVDNTGMTDVTAKLNELFADGVNHNPNTTYYLPNGTYLISSEVFTGPWTYVQGQSTDGTVIKLKDSCPGYQSASTPKWVTGTICPTCRNTNNVNFEPLLRNITVNTGKGNPGAIGIDYMANNGGGLQNVKIMSGDGLGVAGIEMTAQWPGPAYCKNLVVDGFNYGVITKEWTYSNTFTNVTLLHQKIAGFYNRNHAISLENLVSDNTVPAVLNAEEGQMVLINADLRSGLSSVAGIKNEGNGAMYLRSIRLTGYGTAIDDQGKKVTGQFVDEYATGSPAVLQGSQWHALKLPIRSTPLPSLEPQTSWANVKSFESHATAHGGDWGYAIKAAIASGKSTLFFPLGGYRINATVEIPSSVHWIIGLGADFQLGTGSSPGLRVKESSATPLVLFGTIWGSDAVGLEQAGSRSVVLYNVRGIKYHSVSGAGDLFGDNVVGGGWVFDAKGQSAWLRQWNSEGGGNPGRIINNGARLWVLGLKSEGGGTDIVLNSRESAAEVLGGIMYPTNGGDYSRPSFVCNEGRISVSIAMFSSQDDFCKATWNGNTATYKIVRFQRNMSLFACNPDNHVFQTSTIGTAGTHYSGFGLLPAKMSRLSTGRIVDWTSATQLDGSSLDIAKEKKAPLRVIITERQKDK